MRVEDCISYEGRIDFVQSTLDEVQSPSEADIEREEFVVINGENGDLNVFVRDTERAGKWRSDWHRAVDWQESRVTHCSRIRDGGIATINRLNERDFVLLWQVDAMDVVDYVDSLTDVNEVHWAPLANPKMLFIATKTSICAYDAFKQSMIYVVYQANMSLYANLSTCVAYDTHNGTCST